MAEHKSDAERIANDRNVPRFCVENRQIAWVLMVATVLWGAYGYFKMPKRKDPVFGSTRAAVVCAWPGVSADKIEQLVTKKIEAKIAGNVKIEKLESVSRSNLSIVLIALEESTVSNVDKQWDDIALRLNSINDLPDGAGPINFLRDFGETAALMVTVASPKAGAAEISWRSDQVRAALEAARAKAPAGRRTAGIICFPISVGPVIPRRVRDLFIQYAKDNGRGPRSWCRSKDQALSEWTGISEMMTPQTKPLPTVSSRDRLRPSEIHPDIWPIAFIADLARPKPASPRRLATNTASRNWTTYTELIQRTLEAVPEVSKVNRSGVLAERIYLEYSQARAGLLRHSAGSLAADPGRNVTRSFPAAISKSAARTCCIDPSGEFKSDKEIGNILLDRQPARRTGLSARRRRYLARDTNLRCI